MKFIDRKTETENMILVVCLILSLGAIFLQIWILSSSFESYLAGKTQTLMASLLLSGLALACCSLTAWTTFLFSPEKDISES